MSGRDHGCEMCGRGGMNDAVIVERDWWKARCKELEAAIEKHRDEYNKLCAKYPASDVSADIDARLYAAIPKKGGA